MYIEISKSIADELCSGSSQFQQNIEDMFQCCVFAMKKGSHYICTETADVAKRISDYFQTKSIMNVAIAFDYIYRNFSVLCSPRHVLIYYVSIGMYTNQFYICNVSKDGRTVIQVSVTIAKDYYFWDECFLLPENVGDCAYIERIVKYQQEKQKNSTLKSLDFAYRPEQGGGSGNILQIFKQRRKENSFVFAILDSDKKTPINDNGDTARKFLLDPYSEPLKNYFFIILNVHELENLFSSNGFLHQVGYNDTAIHKIQDAEIKRIESAADIRIYYDFKDGVCYKNSHAYPYLNYLFGPFHKHHTCSLNCSACSEKHCSVVFSPVNRNEKFLSKLFERLSALGTGEPAAFDICASGLHSKIKREWQRIFMYFITVCCAKKVMTPGL